MYYLAYGFLYLFSLLPLPILYVFSNFLAFLIQHVFKYRKAVIHSNLKIAFPEKTILDRKKIAKEFYLNFTDSFIETIKLLSAGNSFINKRCTANFDVINQLALENRRITMLAGHQFNWEFGNLFASQKILLPFVGVYMPIKNKFFEKMFLKLRTRNGTNLIPKSKFNDEVLNHFQLPYVFALVADQNPKLPANAIWLNFFSKPVPFIHGPAKGAIKVDSIITMINMIKIKRGYYQFHIQLLSLHAKEYTAEQLTIVYKNELEKNIQKNPSNYLWSHRRWKYEWTSEYPIIIKE